MYFKLACRTSTASTVFFLFVKRVYNSSVVKSCITIHYRCWTGFAVVKTGLLIPYSPSTGNRVVKTGLLKLYKLSTGIVVVKTGMTILYRLSTSFVVVKTGLLNIYRPSTALWYSKFVCPTSTGSQQDLLYFKFAVLQTGLPNLYRASTDFADYNSSTDLQWSQNWLAKLLRSFNWQCGCQNW